MRARVERKGNPVRISTRALAAGCALLLTVVCALTLAAAAHARKTVWNVAGASVYGGVCESGATGYRGDFLPNLPNSFAELNMGSALGGLPYRARIRILYRGRKLTVVKRDIGGGGGPVFGVHRSIDLWEGALYRLLGYHACNWTGVVLYRRL